MTEEYPDQGTEDQDQSVDAGFWELVPPSQHDAERTVATGPPMGDAQMDGSELTVADPPPTGDDRVDAAVAGLSRLAGRPVDDHVAVLEEVHGRLRDILGELGETPKTPEGHERR